ncbi:MAG: N-acetylglucosamine-6-phosphate deacetylase [Candidatus Dormibacteria bacterium]
MSDPPPSTLLRGGTVVSGGVETRSDVLLRDGRVSAVGELDGSADVVIDASGWFVIPGLVDVHVHGAGGHDATGGVEALAGMGRTLARLGTTSFLATSASLDPASMLGFARDVADAARPADGADLLGAHLEGPWISASFRGAHRAEVLRPPRVDEVDAVLQAGRGRVRRVTMAPELDGASEAMAMLHERGVGVSAGHSGIGIELAARVLDAGATVTHLFNGMAPMHHRDPGLAGAALAHPTAVCELIAEGVHVHPHLLRIAGRALGVERALLVSDGLPLMGAPGSRASWNGASISSDGPVARMPDGALAGSVTDLLSAVRLFASAGRVSRAEALRAATEVPASVAGVATRKGLIEVGFDADVVLLDASWAVVATWCRGVRAWQANAELRERGGESQR